MFRYIALLVVSLGCYIAAYAVSGILFIWFNPGGYDCGLNVFFLSMTMILCFVFAVVALHPKVMNRKIFMQLKLYFIFHVFVQYEFLGNERTHRYFNFKLHSLFMIENK